MKYKSIQVPPAPENEIHESVCAMCGMMGGVIQMNVKYHPKCLNCNTPLTWKPTGRYATMKVVPDPSFTGDH